jgi:putative flippase GtrA
LQILKRYLTYLFIGGIVGVLALVSREGIGRLLPDTRFWYAFLILIIYCCGILISFVLQKRYTFGRGTSIYPRRQLFLFVVLAVFTGCLTMALSYFFRYALNMDALFGGWAATIAFAVAILLTSTLSFILNSRFVFRTSCENNKI